MMVEIAARMDEQMDHAIGVVRLPDGFQQFRYAKILAE
jgi:hypothetical protein